VNFGVLYKQSRKLDQASEYFRRALQVHPEDGHALVQLASLDQIQQSENVVRLDSDYVVGLFDGYSQRFEHELVHVLQYVGHKLVADALLAQDDWLQELPKKSSISIVDIGCGTGLLGELLRLQVGDFLLQSCSTGSTEQRARPSELRIVGVDLSERMVDLAQQRNSKYGVPVYDEVRVSDASQYLRTLKLASVSAITASDVLIYVGALEEIFGECARALEVGGIFAFTVELSAGKGEQDGVKLLKSGRFGHSKKHIEEVAYAHGFELSLWRESVLRQQSGQDVPGAVAVLKRIY